MDHVSALLAQRSVGEVRLGYGPGGVMRHREAGSAKIRLPKGCHEAILINTSGGLAGGDQLTTEISLEAGAHLSVTTQAAERVYRSLGPAAEIAVKLAVAAGACLHWLPQETIQFEASRLSRQITAEVAADGELLMAESFVLGRAAMGEAIAETSISDAWDIFSANRLVHAERFRLGPKPPRGAATLAAAQAFATLLLISPYAEARAAAITKAVAGLGAVSCWNGKLLARLVAEDGYELKKALGQALAAATGGKAVPRVWAL